MDETELLERIRALIVDSNDDPVENLIDTLIDLMMLDPIAYNELIDNVAATVHSIRRAEMIEANR